MPQARNINDDQAVDNRTDIRKPLVDEDLCRETVAASKPLLTLGDLGCGDFGYFNYFGIVSAKGFEPH